MTEPLRFSFDVACPVEHAFGVWTAGIGTWWPADHTVSGAPDSRVVLEGRPGGRIYERTVTGEEHDWGQVTVWEPPSRLGYLWHLRADRADATDVTVSFVPVGEDVTRSRSSTPAGSGSGTGDPGGASATTAAGRRCSRTTSPPSTGLLVPEVPRPCGRGR